jgi:hypothetical protein
MGRDNAPRGRIVRPPLTNDAASQEPGRKVSIIVYLQSHVGNKRIKAFWHKCGVLKLTLVQVQQIGAFIFVYECTGTQEAVEALKTHPLVIRWHYVIATGTYTCGIGKGQVKKPGSHSESRHQSDLSQMTASGEIGARAVR